MNDEEREYDEAFSRWCEEANALADRLNEEDVHPDELEEDATLESIGITGFSRFGAWNAEDGLWSAQDEAQPEWVAEITFDEREGVWEAEAMEHY